MIDETRQVLEMVANGTVTPDQAEELLEALDDRPPTSYAPPNTTAGERTHWRGRRRERERSRKISNPALAELAQAAMHGVDAEYIREMRRLGFVDMSLEDLTELSIHGVDPDFVEEMRGLGFTDLTPDDLIQLSISGIDEEFVREMAELGYLHPTAADAVRARRSEMVGAGEEER